MAEYKPELSIEGLQALQAENARMVAALVDAEPVLQLVAADLHRYAVSITHVDTGALRASHRMTIYATSAEIYLDPSARNSRTGQLTAMYGPVEEARGGAHAFYARTVAERGPGALDRAQQYLEQHL